MSAQYQCNNCGRGYVCPPRGRVGLFCSMLCRNLYWHRHRNSGRDSFGLLDDAAAPSRWDGRSQYSVGVMVHTYRVYCVCCGADTWYALSHQEVRSLRALPSCETCGGTRWIEEDFNPQWHPMYAGAEQSGDDLETPRPVLFDSQLNWWKASA